MPVERRTQHQAASIAVLMLASATLLAACGHADSSAVDFVIGAVDLDSGAFPASRLREHPATLQPIAVAYRMDEGSRLAKRLVDALWFTL